MSRIYEEALLDAKKIRDAAEQAAKDRIMETITPQIRQMINSRILFEQEEMQEPDGELSFSIEEDEEDDEMNLDFIVDKLPDTDIGEDVMDAAADAAVSVFAAGDVNIEVEQEDDSDEVDDDLVDLMTDTSLAEAFAKIIRKDFLPDNNLAERIETLDKRARKLKEVLSVISESNLSKKQQERLELSFISLVKETVSLQSDLRHSGRGSQRLKSKLNSTIKGMREMSSMYRKNIFDFLFEAEEDKTKLEGMMEQDEAETEEVEVEETDADEADVDVEAASTALEDLGDALGLDLEIAEEGDVEDEEEYEEEDEGEELDLEEGGHLEEQMYEVNEAALRKELRRMRRRRLREQEEAIDTYSDPSPAKEIGDVYLDVDEEDLINALADELGTVTAGEEVDPEELAESRRRRSSRSSRRTSSLRKALREASEYKKAAKGLKKQLVEMNLFNAKLLYANKLLQNKNLTNKQQRAIVEALDNAKTLREAKLLYKSLSDSLAKRGRSGKTLSESVRRTLGSSSRSTRSGSSTNSGVETDRWAVLAGIGK